MTTSSLEPSPNAERLRVALGWDRLPLMTPEEHAAFEAKERQFREEVRRFYGGARPKKNPDKK